MRWDVKRNRVGWRVFGRERMRNGKAKQVLCSRRMMTVLEVVEAESRERFA
jgi:hypothetical protein